MVWVVPVHPLSSPWAPATWTIRLNLGREKGTDAPPEYGAGGGRLVLPVVVQVESTTIPSHQKDPFVGSSGASVLSPLSKASYVPSKGEQFVDFLPGGWALAFPPSQKPGAASTLRCWLDLGGERERERDGAPIAMAKNDIVLPFGTRLLLGAKAWREDALKEGKLKIRPRYEQALAAQTALEAALSHESGDRRLDGKDALDTLKAYGDTAGLVLERNSRRAELLEALQEYPPLPGFVASSSRNRASVAALFPDQDTLFASSNDEDLPEGPWPGAEEWLTLSTVGNPIFALPPTTAGKGFSALWKGAQARKSFLAGTWTATPILEEGDYELVDEDD